jgi:hypothetical protein
MGGFWRNRRLRREAGKTMDRQLPLLGAKRIVIFGIVFLLIALFMANVD